MIEEQMRYLAGFGVHAQEDVAQSPSTVRFLHGDLTRSTMMTSDTSATVLSRVAYTAFGDPVTPDGQGGWRVGWPIGEGGVGVPPVTRYQYDGGWGYESGAWGPGPGGQGAVGGPLALWGEDTTLPPVTLQHVGWRWYQPGIGRFIQRDPIGIGGGLNVYSYCDAGPLAGVDPEGQFSLEKGIVGLVVGGAAGALGGPKGAIVGGIAGFILTGYEEGDAEQALVCMRPQFRDGSGGHWLPPAGPGGKPVYIAPDGSAHVPGIK